MKSNGKKLHSVGCETAVVVAASAIALATAGTAQAGGLDVNWGGVVPGAGLVATVTDLTGEPSHCTYTATAVNLPLPPYQVTFDLGPKGEKRWVIPVLATGTTWRTVVVCRDHNLPSRQISYFDHTEAF
jgi:hypothetical protein